MVIGDPRLLESINEPKMEDRIEFFKFTNEHHANETAYHLWIVPHLYIISCLHSDTYQQDEVQYFYKMLDKLSSITTLNTTLHTT